MRSVVRIAVAGPGSTSCWPSPRIASGRTRTKENKSAWMALTRTSRRALDQLEREYPSHEPEPGNSREQGVDGVEQWKRGRRVRREDTRDVPKSHLPQVEETTREVDVGEGEDVVFFPVSAHLGREASVELDR